MALKEPYMVKSQFGVGADTAVELEAKTGESLLVKDVLIWGADDNYCLLEVEKTTVGFFRLDNHAFGSHLPSVRARPSADYRWMGFETARSVSLISLMIRQGWMRGYPVAEGQTFRVKPYTSGKKLNNVMIIYEKYDAGDIKATDENGSEGRTYIFVNYGRPESSITSSGDNEISVSVTTEEFPDFPFGKAVPSKTTIDILGIVGSEAINYVDANNYVYTKYLKMFKGRTCLFDRDKKGLPFYQPTFSDISAATHYARGFSVIGNYTERDRRHPFIPPKPLTFKEGEEVKVYITTGAKGSSASISTQYSEIGFIEKVTIAE